MVGSLPKRWRKARKHGHQLLHSRAIEGERIERGRLRGAVGCSEGDISFNPGLEPDHAARAEIRTVGDANER